MTFLRWCPVLASLFVLSASAPNASAALTVDDAVRMALVQNSQIVSSKATVLDARGGAYSAYSGILPRVSGSVTRFQSTSENQAGGRNVGGTLTQPFTSDFEVHGTNPTLTGSWNLLDLSGWASVISARRSQAAARHSLQSTRNEVAFATRRQYYEVVKAIKLSLVADSALRLSRDDERRVRALFEVGSVSKNDLLRAQVRTAQSELDSLTRRQSIVGQRILLADQLGIAEERMDDVDTTLVTERHTNDLEALVTEATRQRPDLHSAEVELAAARANVTAARLDYLPYVSGSASMTFNPTSRSTSTIDPPGTLAIPPGVSSSESESDRETSASIAVNMDLFNGMATQARNATAKARLMRSQESRDQLQRGLRGEVHRAVLGYEAAVAGEQVARRALESASESLKLAREKYNVGSATILDLIDAQVSHERAAADLVSALAAIRVADAELDRVRGRAE